MQGRLYLNSALAHFTEESPTCTFCRITAVRELTERGVDPDRIEYNYYLSLLPNESLIHLFWECEHVQQTIKIEKKDSISC